MKSSLMRKMKMTTTASLSTPSSNLSDMEKRQIYSNTKECHSLFFLTLVQLHQSLWKLWWLQHQTPKLWAPQLQHCPYSTQGLLTHCHTQTHDVAAAGHHHHHTPAQTDISDRRGQGSVAGCRERRISPATPLINQRSTAATTALHKNWCCLMQSS